MSQALTTPPQKLPISLRLTLTGLATLSLLLLITARYLEPDRRGYGTHQQLGLTQCRFRTWTNHPCPTCGATTAWAHVLRGNFAKAATANLGGVVACLATLLSVPWLLIAAALGRWPIVQPQFKPLLLLATAWLILILLDWLRRW